MIEYGILTDGRSFMLEHRMKPPLWPRRVHVIGGNPYADGYHDSSPPFRFKSEKDAEEYAREQFGKSATRVREWRAT
jgi:hypothetical protein